MKILITTPTYAPLADGVAEHARVLSEGFARRGHDVTVVTEFHPNRKPEALAANPQVVQFKISGTANWRIGVRGEIAAYQQFLRNFSGDIIMFECWDAWPTYLAEPLLKLIKAKKVLAIHGYAPHIWDFKSKFPWGLGQWIGGWPLFLRTPFLMRKFDQLVFLSARRDFGRFLDRHIARLTGFTKFSIIPNGAFAREFNTVGLPDFWADKGIKPGLLLLCVANYSDRKNQLLAVRAFRRAQLKDATLVFIGSEFNNYADEVRHLDVKLQREFPAGRVLLLEKQTRAQTCAAYNAADVFVLAAKAETQPIVLLEAMASHTPWISTDTGCVSELPGGVVARSENELIEKMRGLANSPYLRKEIADAGWTACQKTYDWEKVIEAYILLFKKLHDSIELDKATA